MAQTTVSFSFPSTRTQHRVLISSLFALLALCGCGVTTGPMSASPVPPAEEIPLSLVLSQDESGNVRIAWSGGQPGTSYEIYLDDTPLYRQPILKLAATVNPVTINSIDTGLATGVMYHAKIVAEGGHGTAETTFRLSAHAWAEPGLSYAYARAAWASAGRAWMTATTGVAWNAETNSWRPVEPWLDEYTNVAQDAYASTYAALGAVNMGAVKHDLALLNELAAFYVAYESRFTTLGAMKTMTQYDTSMLTGPDSTETLIWVWQNGNTTYVRECDLCNSQFYYPATRLLRVITTLDASEITPAMRSFASWYGPVLARDHLLRLLYRNNGAWLSWIQNGPGGLTDTALWVNAEAAELLGAHANAPEMVALSSDEVSELQQAIRLTVQTLQSKYQTKYSDTRDFQGQTVGSTSYFNGSYVYGDLPSYAYSGYSGEAFPTASDAAYQPGASWDVSHLHRVPIFFRALFDNKKATGEAFPTQQDILLLTNQFVYKTFQGNLELPLFNNFFDGSNGWYRVGYDGGHFGYPPAQYCNNYESERSRNDAAACLNSGAVQGWGLVSFANADLADLEHCVAKLAVSQDTAQKSFRTRYYYYWNSDFSQADANSQPQYPVLLFFVMADTADRLQ